MKMENSRKDGCDYVHTDFEKISKGNANYGGSL